MSFPAEGPGLRRREAILTLLNQPGEGRLGAHKAYSNNPPLSVAIALLAPDELASDQAT